MAGELNTSLLTKLALEMPSAVSWQDGESSDAETTRTPSSPLHTKPPEKDRYEAVHHELAVVPPTPSDIAAVPVAVTLLDPAAGPRNDGFPDPLTGEFVPHTAITRKYMTDLTRRGRHYFSSFLQGFLERIDRGEDPTILFAELQQFYPLRKEILARLNPLARWFGKTNTNDEDSGRLWHTQYVHRLLRPIQYIDDLSSALKYLRLALEHSEDILNLHLQKVRQGCIKDDNISIGLIIHDVCKLLEYSSQIFNQKIGRPNFIIRFHYKIETPFDKLDPLVTPFNWDVLEEILEELVWNGIKYGKSFVDISWDAEDNALVVTNDGPGIPEGLDIFASGQRGDHAQIEGTGFGLSNALNDASTNGWILSFSSQPGKTQFRLKLKY